MKKPILIVVNGPNCNRLGQCISELRRIHKYAAEAPSNQMKQDVAEGRQ